MRLLVTGGTGSFGSAFVESALEWAESVIVYSRDELKQSEMAERLPDACYVLGDIRDRDRLAYAMRGCDAVVHAAAMKRVPECEANASEAVQTNVDGSRNVALVASQLGCRAVALSTDKATIPTNTYGATKLLSERLFLEAGFSAVRCGNIWRSRGSVVPLFEAARETGTVTITDPRMTRYSITLPEVVDIVTRALSLPQGLVYVPTMPSYRITDLAEAIAPGCTVKVTGARPGERLHECLITEAEATDGSRNGSMYVIGRGDGTVSAQYSNENAHWLTVEELRAL